MSAQVFIDFAFRTENILSHLVSRDLCNLLGDGGLASPSRAIQPEHEGNSIDHACCPINDLVDNGDSGVRMAFRGIGSII